MFNDGYGYRHIQIFKTNYYALPGHINIIKQDVRTMGE